MATLTAKCALEMDCPKEVIVWNYYDHEHVVGTHYKYYSHFKILAERDDWCMVERYYRLPIIKLRTSSLGFMFAETPNLYRSIQYGKLGVILNQEIQLDDLEGDRCRVTCIYTMNVPSPFMVFETLFQNVVTVWFNERWVQSEHSGLQHCE